MRLTAAAWLVAGVADAAAPRAVLPTPTFGVLTSAAQPMTANITADPQGTTLQVSTCSGSGDAVDLGSAQSGTTPAPVCALRILHYDTSLPLAYSVSGDLAPYVRVVPDTHGGLEVDIAFTAPLPSVASAQALSGAVTVTIGNDWDSASFPMTLTVVPVPQAAPQPSSSNAVAPVNGTVTGTISGVAPDDTVGATIDVSGTVSGSVSFQSGTDTITLPVTNLPVTGTVTDNGQGTVTGSVYGTVTESVYGTDQNGNEAGPFTLSGTVSGTAYGYINGNGGFTLPLTVTGSVYATVTGTVYGDQTVTGSTYGSGS